ncbi:class I SAM-dependent methyltransferase [Actinoplanes aureus]|uniref:Methyltransferase domain-containing protein n=1 Tax=Actinoplanes aureus TaxID=2792083 RepID=A0A931C2W4_9ACTN|nr:methyltransferase domain-containing protein [Actinoplanes aureus]
MGVALAAAAGIRAGDRVLDVGCGRGAVLFPAARAAGPRGRVTGIDLAPAMVELTRADAAGLPQVEVAVGDAQAPDFPESSFDVVTAGLLLFFLPDPGAALRAYRKLLRPRGTLAFSTFAEFDPRHRASMQAVARHAVDPPRQAALSEIFQDAARLRATVAEAGFDGTRAEELTVRSEFRDVEHYVAWIASHSGRDVLRRVPMEGRADLLAELATILPDPPELTTTIRLTVAHRPG